jgi:hypothetical protein
VTLYHAQKLLSELKDYYEWCNGEGFKVSVTYLTAAFKNWSGTS